MLANSESVLKVFAGSPADVTTLLKAAQQMWDIFSVYLTKPTVPKSTAVLSFLRISSKSNKNGIFCRANNNTGLTAAFLSTGRSVLLGSQCK